MSSVPYSHLLNHIRRFVSLTDREELILCKLLSERTLKKKEILLAQEEICEANYFIVSGCLYTSMAHESGHEQVVQFGIENWWISDYSSLDGQKPSRFTIRALENSQVIVLSRDIETELFTQIPKLERYFRIVVQRAYAATLQRIQFIFTMSGEERYHHFANAFPSFVQRVPQYILASYLGFTPEFLSKIRAKRN
jgi:CRP/FNR family transcriptional regulator, anaerobic regulatory protein